MSTVYSRNEEDWYEYEDIIDGIEADYQSGDKVEIFEGDAVLFTHKEFINVDRIIEDIQEAAYDEIGEWQQDYLDDLAGDKDKMIELNKLLLDFITENAKVPTCYKVVNVKEIKIHVE